MTKNSINELIQSHYSINKDKLLIDGLHSIDSNEYENITKHVNWLRDIILLTENIPIGVSIASRQPNEKCEHPLVYVNKAFSSITQYPREEIVGRNCNFLQGNILYPELNTKLEMSKKLEKGEISKCLITNFKKDGTKFRNLLTLFPIINLSNEILYYMGIQCDVTSELTPYSYIQNAEDLMNTIPHIIDIYDVEPIHPDLDNLFHAIGTWKIIHNNSNNNKLSKKRQPHCRDTIIHDDDKITFILNPDIR